MPAVVVGKRTELLPVPDGLLEVVADDLVELDQIRATLLKPRREALVEVGARRLRQRLVGRVADQQMTEAVAVVACQLRLLRTKKIFADERGQPRVDPRLAGTQRRNRATVEDLALHRPALEHVSLGRAE